MQYRFFQHGGRTRKEDLWGKTQRVFGKMVPFKESAGMNLLSGKRDTHPKKG